MMIGLMKKHIAQILIGTGYLTACFAVMVGSQGRCVGVEHIPELVASSMKNIEASAASPLVKEGSLALHVGGEIKKFYKSMFLFVYVAGSMSCCFVSSRWKARMA